jgi:hypothetical protein
MKALPMTSSERFAATLALIVWALALTPCVSAETAIRDLCSARAEIRKATLPTSQAGSVARPEVARIEIAPIQVVPISRAEIIRAEIPVADHPIAQIQIATIDLCVHPSPTGIRYDPETAGRIRQQYINSLVTAGGVSPQSAAALIDLNVSAEVTTPPPYLFYRTGDSVPSAAFAAEEECLQARQETDDAGACEKKDGSVFISISGTITNKNQFPVSEVHIACEYTDAQGTSGSVTQRFLYTLAPDGGSVPILDHVVAELPSQSVVNDVSCSIESATVWQKDDDIQYLSTKFQRPPSR